MRADFARPLALHGVDLTQERKQSADVVGDPDPGTDSLRLSTLKKALESGEDVA